jgi:hypothetical protein
VLAPGLLGAPAKALETDTLGILRRGTARATPTMETTKDRLSPAAPSDPGTGHHERQKQDARMQ